MADPVNTYNLEKLMSLYATSLESSNSEAELLSERLINVVIIGMNHLNFLQTRKLREFSDRVSSKVHDKRLVTILKSVLINRQTETGLPRELYVMAHTFRMPPAMAQYSPADKQDFLLHVASILRQTSTGEHPFKIKELVHNTKVILACLEGNLIESATTSTLIPSLKNLLEKIPTKKVSTIEMEFQELACIVVKKLEEGSTPEEIVEHKAFHGDALRSALRQIEENFLKGNFEVNATISLFVDYCEQTLAMGQYMIRHSSRAYKQGENFFFTVSYRTFDGKLHHTRAAKIITKEAKVEWRWSDTKGKFKEKSYDSLEKLLESHQQVKNLSPTPIISREEAYDILNQSLLTSFPNIFS